MPVTTQNRVNRLSGLNTLAYMGVESYTPPSIFQLDRDPTAHDYQGFRIGDIWLSGSGLGIDVWMLAGLNNPSPVGRAYWTQIGIGGTGLTFHTNSGNAVPNGGIVNVFGGSNITTNAVIGAPNTVNIDMNDDVDIPGSLKLSFLGAGVIQSDALGNLSTSNGLDGQVIIGGGAAPAWASIVSGDASITITPGANTLDIRVPAGTSFAGLVANDLNTAAPDGADKIDVVGDSVITKTDAGIPNTLTISLTGGLDKQFIGGQTATGVPVWKTLTSSGGTVTITNFPTTVNIEAAGVAALTQLDGDVGPGALPFAGAISLHGVNCVTTDAGTTPNQVDIGLDETGTDGQIIIAQTGGAPAWADVTSTNSTIDITGGANTLDLDIAGGNVHGTLLIGDATAGYASWHTLTAGANITITEAAHSITIAASGGGGGGLVALDGDIGTANLDGASKIKLHGVDLITTDAGATASQVNIGLTHGLNGQIPIGSNIGAPVWATLSSGDSTVSIANAANSIDLRVAAGALFAGLIADDTNTAAPDAVTRKVDVSGDATFITTTSTVANTLDINFGGGTTGQIPISITGSAPHWQRLTAGSNVTIDDTTTPGAIVISAAGSGGSGAGTFPTDSGTATQYLGVLNVYGGTNASTSATTIVNPNDTITIDLNPVLYLVNTNAGGTQGVIYLGGNRYIHNYGTDNTWYGTNSGNTSLTTGSSVSNTGVGAKTLQSLTTGARNTALGDSALKSTTTGADNVGIGYKALTNANNLGAVNSKQNVAIGSSAMENALYTTDGSIAVGYEAFKAGIGDYNVAIGYQSLLRGNGASDSIVIGKYAMGKYGAANAPSGAGNVSIGTRSMSAATTAYGNVVVGDEAMEYATTGYRNVIIGQNAMNAGTTGFENVIIGYNAGSTLTTGGQNIYIGNGVVAGGSSEGDTIRIGGSTHSTAYISGIYGKSLGSSYSAVYIDSTGKLGTGSATTNCAFLAKQTATVNNVSGDGTTEYYLGKGSALSETYDIGSNLYPGNGTTAPAKFTAPVNGLYEFKMTVCISGIPNIPIPGPVIYIDPLLFKVWSSAGALQTTYQLILAPIASSPTGLESFFYSADIYLTATQYVTFSFILLSPSATNDLDVYGEVGTGTYSTYISGSLTSPG